MSFERVLNIFPREDGQRLVVAVREYDDFSQTVLRHESPSDSGWFVQSEITVTAEQIAGLKLMLSSRTTQEICPDVLAKRDVIPIGQGLKLA